MTDNAIQTMDAASLLAELQGLGPAASAPARLQLPSIRALQSMSDDVKEGKAKAGDFIISFGAGSVQDPIYTNKLRVMSIDGLKGRVMWKLKPDGQKDMSAKKPLCASNNGEQPRLGEFFGYVGQTFSDYRRRKDGEVIEHTTTESCKDCPLRTFLPAYSFDKKGELIVDENGKAVTEKKSDGKPRMLKPPCNETESHVVYLIDYGMPAIIRASSPTVRIGLKKLPDYFSVTASGSRPFIKDDGVHVVEIVNALEEYAGNGSKTYVPKITLSAEPVDISFFQQYVALLKRYNEENIREALTSPERTDYDSDEEYADAETVPVAAAEAETMDAATARTKLGGGKNRRMASNEDPFSDDE